MSTDPIDNVVWKRTDELDPNSYNPNHVLRPELALLERSILSIGWVQPILINPDGVIIDGYHRWRLSVDSPHLRERYKGMVPCAVLDVDRAEAMVLTVRMNRAKGVHAAVKMHDIVRELVDVQGMSQEAVAKEIGATKDEVALLYQDGVFAAKDIANWTYSKAWYPDDTGKDHLGRKRETLADLEAREA